MVRAVGVSLPFPLLTIDWREQTSTTKVLDAPRVGSFGNRGLLRGYGGYDDNGHRSSHDQHCRQ